MAHWLLPFLLMRPVLPAGELYSELAQALQKKKPRLLPGDDEEAPTSRVRRKRPPPDRSRDHAIYAAPHKPPPVHRPTSSADLQTFKIPRELVTQPDETWRFAVACAIAGFGLALILTDARLSL